MPDPHPDETADVASVSPTTPPPPVEPEFDEGDPKTLLQRRVKSALLALPGYFSFDSPISGINATDLFNLNTLLGAGIEVAVVRTLNRLREVWDPDDELLGYRFERSSQAFPDVRLVRRDTGTPDIALGIELKGWFLLAKEGVPSLRYQVTPAACAPHDLICVVPWHLSNAVAGDAQVVEPWIRSARYAAEWRDYWWEFVRQTKGASPGVDHPGNAQPYPSKAELVAAVPRYDGGGNFGRLPRCKPLMDDFIDRTGRHEILGIPVQDWQLFLRVHSDTATPDDTVKTLQARLNARLGPLSGATAERVLYLLEEVAALLRP